MDVENSIEHLRSAHGDTNGQGNEIKTLSSLFI